MDPLTQGLLGATASRNAAVHRSDDVSLAQPVLWGMLAGMAADLDVLIRSGSDPLLFLEYHRQFTHSLIFIPLGAAICCLVLKPLLDRKQRWSWPLAYMYCLLGYATHALLDACTTYGTQLLWPFSDARIAWNVMSIIDPLYTLPIALFMLLSWRRASKAWARLALIWVLAYPLAGWFQHERAEAVGFELAERRGHKPVDLDAKPSFANLLLWKVVYRYEGQFYVDAVRVGLTETVFEGESIAELDWQRDLPWLPKDSRLGRDVQRFAWFSNQYVAMHPDDQMRVIDIRYSMLPNEINPLWSVALPPDWRMPVRYEVHRDASDSVMSEFWRQLFDQ